MDKNIESIPANWENTPEAFLAEIKIGEIVPDFSPDMLDLASE